MWLLTRVRLKTGHRRQNVCDGCATRNMDTPRDALPPKIIRWLWGARKDRKTIKFRPLSIETGSDARLRRASRLPLRIVLTKVHGKKAALRHKRAAYNFGPHKKLRLRCVPLVRAVRSSGQTSTTYWPFATHIQKKSREPPQGTSISTITIQNMLAVQPGITL